MFKILHYKCKDTMIWYSIIFLFPLQWDGSVGLWYYSSKQGISRYSDPSGSDDDSDTDDEGFPRRSKRLKNQRSKHRSGFGRLLRLF